MRIRRFATGIRRSQQSSRASWIARRHPLLAGLFAFILFGTASAAGAGAQEKRVALVIGNAAYKSLPALKNSVNDAIDMAGKLASLGFEVIKVTDATQQAMEAGVREFGEELAGSDVGLFYYSGHGVQSAGINYLIPVDADVKAEMDLKYKTVQADFVLDYMSNAGCKLNIIVLDACRDNPFAAFRTATRGLAIISAPRGSIVVYSTSPGSVAEDGLGRNGTFTSALLKNIETPGLDMKQMFDKVGQEVQGATGGRQVPWLLSSYFGTFQFAHAAASEVASAPPSSAPVSAMSVQKAFGSIQVEVKTGAKVFVDGVGKGELGPGAVGTISGMEVGSRSVEVRYADGHIDRQTLTVERDKTAAASFSYVVPPPSASPPYPARTGPAGAVQSPATASPSAAPPSQPSGPTNAAVSPTSAPSQTAVLQASLRRRE